MTRRTRASRFIRDPNGNVVGLSRRGALEADAPQAVGNIQFIDGSGLIYPDPRPRTSATQTAAEVAARTEVGHPEEINFAHPNRGPAPVGFVGALPVSPRPAKGVLR